MLRNSLHLMILISSTTKVRKFSGLPQKNELQDCSRVNAEAVKNQFSRFTICLSQVHQKQKLAWDKKF